jgi:hypothetical protein
MAEELGKIEKPAVEEYITGRKLFFVPLVFSAPDLPQEFTEKYNRYWEQVDSQIAGLEIKLGPIKYIFHELVPEAGEEAIKTIKQLKVNSLQIIESRREKGALLEAMEDEETLAELMDWSRCLAVGLQSQKAYASVYEFYTEANKKRNEFISKKINETLKENESAIVIMGENHHVQFPSDMRIFYVAPPALDELKRWMRDYESKAKEKPPEQTGDKTEEKPPQNN